jgi:DNA polymerase III epsilon subunit-like protein
MSYIIVDVEADGPIPHRYSMVCFGAVVLEPALGKIFYGKTKPVSEQYIPEALAVSGFTRQQHEAFEKPEIVMADFEKWIRENSKGQPIFISDSNGFDWQWMNWYFQAFVGKHPFGFSSRRIGDLYCGMKMDTGLNTGWKRLFRKTRHDHNPVNDAKGNAEALLEMKKMGLKIPAQ